MKKQLRFLTAALAAGAIVTGSMFNVQAYADDTTTTAVDIDSRPHFDTNGYAVINGLQFHKTSDTTVAVSKGMDFNASKIEIPSSISVDDVRYSVTTIADNAFKNTSDDGKVYAAQKISIPTSIISLGSQCLYDLVNIESLDLTPINYYYISDTKLSINRDVLDMNSTAKLDRVKTNVCYYSYKGYPRYTYRFFTNNAFQPIAFCDESGNTKSCWYIKNNVRINELQDPEVKNGYTFTGWNSKTVQPGNAAEAVRYTQYTPSYEKGQPLWDAEDKIKSALNNLAVNEDTKQSEIVKLVKSCITFDNILYTVDDFRIVPAQNEVRGALRCKINLTNKNDNSKQVIEVDKYLTDLPEVTRIKPLIDNYVYKESTSENDIIDYLKTNLDDIGLDIKIENFNNDKKQVKGTIVITNKLDGLSRKFELNKVVHDNINLLIEDAISHLKINSKTKEESVRNQIAKYVGDDRYEISIMDYENVNGKITGTVVVKYQDGVLTTVDLNEPVQQRSQNLQQAYDIAKANLEKFTPSDTTTEEDAIKYISNGVEDSAIEISITNFRNKNYTVKGTVRLHDVDSDEVKTLELNKTTIEGAINLNVNDMKTNKDTTIDDLYEILRKQLGDDVDFEIIDFKNDNGHITATVIIHDKTKGDVTVNVDKTSVSQTVQEAVDIINKNLTDYVPTNTTKGSEAIQDLTKGIKDADITVTIPDFNNDGQTVTGTIIVSKKDGTSANIILNKKTALVGGTGDNTGTSGTQTGSGSQSGSGTSGTQTGSGSQSGSGTSGTQTGTGSQSGSGTSGTQTGSGTQSGSGAGGTQTGSGIIPSNGGATNNSSTSSSSSTGGSSSANPNNTNSNTNTTGASNSSVSGGNSTNNNTNTTGNNTNTTGTNSVSLDNLSISGGGSTSSTGAITFNPSITNSTPVNLTVNLDGFELANKDKTTTTTTTTTTTNGIVANNSKNDNITSENDFLKLLILKYLQGMN